MNVKIIDQSVLNAAESILKVKAVQVDSPIRLTLG